MKDIRGFRISLNFYVFRNYDVIPIEHRYFDESSYLAKTPSYVWYNSGNEIKAFVLNTESIFEDIGLGVKIIGYRDLLFA